jgi:hypothetical protein
MIMRFPTHRPKMKPKLDESRLLVLGQLLSAPFPNHIKPGTEFRRTLSAHHQRDVDAGGWALRSSGAEGSQRLSNAGHRTRIRSTKFEAIDGMDKIESYQRDEGDGNFSDDLVPIALFLRWLPNATRRKY